MHAPKIFYVMSPNWPFLLRIKKKKLKKSQVYFINSMITEEMVWQKHIKGMKMVYKFNINPLPNIYIRHSELFGIGKRFRTKKLN